MYEKYCYSALDCDTRSLVLSVILSSLTVRTFENIPITRNQATRYTDSFFGSGGSGGSSSSDGTFHLTADPDWDSVNGYTF